MIKKFAPVVQGPKSATGVRPPLEPAPNHAKFVNISTTKAKPPQHQHVHLLSPPKPWPTLPQHTNRKLLDPDWVGPQINPKRNNNKTETKNENAQEQNG